MSTSWMVTRGNPWAVAALAAALAGCGGPAAELRGPGDGDGDDHGHHHVVADLDRPVSELLAVRCEHDVAAAACEHCRYEIGMVRVAPALFDPERGGELTVARVLVGLLPLVLEVPGEVRLDQTRSTTVTPLAAGVVRAVHTDMGRLVRAGQVVVELEAPEYREAVAALERSLAAERLARATLTREEELFARGVCPQRDVLEAQTALEQAQVEVRLARGRLAAFGVSAEELARWSSGEDRPERHGLRVRAPIGGRVLESVVSVGTLVQPGDPVVAIGDAAAVWVDAAVPVSELPVVDQAFRAGRVPARVTVAGHPGVVFDGVVGGVAGTLDGGSRMARVRVLLEDREERLRPGMFAVVSIVLPGAGAPGLLVPEEAVLEDEGRWFVFVNVAGDDYLRRPVIPGRSAGGLVEVAGEVREGDRVVSRGAFLLKSDVLRSKMGAGCAD